MAKFKWAGQVRKGDTIVVEGNEYEVTKVAPVFGGSWFDITVKGVEDPAPFGRQEKVEVKG